MTTKEKGLFFFCSVVIGTLFLFAVGAPGCGTVTRVPLPYAAEISWDEAVEGAAAEPVFAQARSSTSAATCARLADLGFALRYRAEYRAAMRRFVAGQGPDPGAAPVVPDVKTICASTSTQGGK